MQNQRTFRRRIRSVIIAIGLAVMFNFAISEVVKSSSGRISESGGVELPKPPSPVPSAIESGGVELPKPPRP